MPPYPGYIRDTTEGFFSRWVVVPFSAFFPASKADPNLIGRLTSHRNLQGLLRAAVGGLQQVMRRGSFTLPASVITATERFKMEADPMRAFIEERIEFTKDTFAPRTEIYTSYTTWAVLNGFSQMSAQRFYESFLAAAVDTSTIGVQPTVRDGTRGFVGMRLI